MTGDTPIVVYGSPEEGTMINVGSSIVNVTINSVTEPPSMSQLLSLILICSDSMERI